MYEELKKKVRKRMDKSINNLADEFKKIRSGRANASLVEGIIVDYYGSRMPLKQLAGISVPEPRLIVIQPWDKNALSAIEKAIHTSDIMLTPNNDGKVIRINVPPLTEERRKELVKVTRAKAEESRVAIRNIRREINEEIKKQEKDGSLGEDEAKRLLDEVQKITDEYISRINDMLNAKESEIMEV